jgi:hypothetical protein
VFPSVLKGLEAANDAVVARPEGLLTYPVTDAR